MRNRFLHNGSPPGFDFKTDIIAGIRNAIAVDIAVSYLQMSGWFLLRDHLAEISRGSVRILTTDQMNITQPAVLKAALRLGVQVKCYCGRRVFHPKVFVFRGNANSRNLAILGSANISASGLEAGVEAGVRISNPLLFKQLGRWFDNLFHDPAAQMVDGRFIEDYDKRWKLAAQSRVRVMRIADEHAKRGKGPTPEIAETLDDVFSTIELPVGTLGFDHAANNIRNLKRLLAVLARYPHLSTKEKSELHLLGFMQDGKLLPLGIKVKSCRTRTAAADLWCSWVKKTPDLELNAINTKLASFKRAADRFWRLKPHVQTFFLREFTEPSQRKTIQAIELCCNGSAVVESLSVGDFTAIVPWVLSGNGLSEFIKKAVTDYRGNKGARSWKSDDRRVVLNAWR